MAKWSEIGCAVGTDRVPLRLLFCSQYIQLFRRERLSEKMCSRQSRKVIWDKYINTLFLTLSLSNLPLLLSFNTQKHTSLTSCVFLSNCLEIKTQNHPQYLSALSSTLFPTTFLEIAVNRLSWNSRPCLKMADWSASCRYLALLNCSICLCYLRSLTYQGQHWYGYMLLWFNFILGSNFIFLCFWVW